MKQQKKGRGVGGGRPPNITGIVLAHKVKREHPDLSYPQKAKLIEKRLGRLPDPKEVWRWERYDLNAVAKL